VIKRFSLVTGWTVHIWDDEGEASGNKGYLI
jgi:hypothetical protein